MCIKTQFTWFQTWKKPSRSTNIFTVYIQNVSGYSRGVGGQNKAKSSQRSLWTPPYSNQIMVVAFQPVQLAQAIVFPTHFVPLISNLAPKIMEEWNNNLKNSDFCKLLRLCAISALQISKKHFATFDFFVKIKLVLTVQIKTPQP